MNRDEADRAITALSAVYDRVAAAMYAIDSDPALAYLRAGGGITGTTLSVWTALRPEVDERWTEFSTFGAGLEQARTDRAQRRPSDPEWSAMTRALSVDLPPLASACDGGCTAIAGILADVSASWATATAAIAPVTDAMTSLRRRSADLGDTAGLAALDGRVALATEHVLTDPLAAAPRGVLRPDVARDLSNLSADIGTASARIADQARVRDGYPDRIASLNAQIDDVAVAEEAVRTAFARANEKIAGAGLPPAPHTCDVLRARLTELDARRAKQQWQRLADDVAMMEATIAHAHGRATELIEAADGLVARRDELRGRLEAYRAKAADHRLDEHETLAPLHMRARELLFTAPCDLHDATRAVYAYQKALTELINVPRQRQAQEDATR
jgi:hypothetical protein